MGRLKEAIGMSRGGSGSRGGRTGGPEWTDPRDYGQAVDLKRYRKGKKLKSWIVFVPVWIGAAAIGTAYGAGWLSIPAKADVEAIRSTGFRAKFSFCHIGGGYNCVVDGDTIWLQGEKIRIADIDAPETHDFRCPSEKKLGDRATARLQALLNTGAVTLRPIDRDEDRYGRKLRIVLVNGTSVGATLVSEGLARWYGNGRQPWC